MTISAHVRKQFFQHLAPSNTKPDTSTPQLIMIQQTRPRPRSEQKPAQQPETGECIAPNKPIGNRRLTWTCPEHERFLDALSKFPSGPWRKIAHHVGTRSTRQVMTHAQKYRQKIARRKRGLKKAVRDPPFTFNGAVQIAEDNTRKLAAAVAVTSDSGDAMGKSQTVESASSSTNIGGKSIEFLDSAAGHLDKQAHQEEHFLTSTAATPTPKGTFPEATSSRQSVTVPNEEADQFAHGSSSFPPVESPLDYQQKTPRGPAAASTTSDATWLFNPGCLGNGDNDTALFEFLESLVSVID